MAKGTEGLWNVVVFETKPTFLGALLDKVKVNGALSFHGLIGWRREIECSLVRCFELLITIGIGDDVGEGDGRRRRQHR